jgi:hypothetical protein
MTSKDDESRNIIRENKHCDDTGFFAYLATNSFFPEIIKVYLSWPDLTSPSTFRRRRRSHALYLNSASGLVKALLVIESLRT